MKYKMIFSDYDGTLLGSDLTVSEKNRRAIADYIARGGKFVLCTGRAPYSAFSIVEDLGLTGMPVPVAGLNGGLIFYNDKSVFKKRTIDNATAIKIVKEGEKRNEYIHFYDERRAIVKELEPINEQYRDITGIELKVVGKLSEYLENNPSFNPVKILFVIDPKKREEIDELFDKLDIPGVDRVMSSRTYYEFIPSSSGKQVAMRELAKYYGVGIDEVIAIGDNGNDAGMIKDAGLGVAVANARAEAKAVADYIAPSNNDDAIAHIIEKFCKE